MKIGIIGMGNIGQATAQLFVRAGHNIVVANSREPETLAGLVAGLGGGARAATVEQAAEFGEIILFAIPFGKYETLPAHAFSNKIVIDATNYIPERDGHLAELEADRATSSELIAAHLPGARVVKAFNTLWSEYLKTKGDTRLALAERSVLLVAGDDSEAKAVVAKLIESTGFAAVDTGFLREGGRRQQPDAPLYNQVVSAVEAARTLAKS